MPKSAKIFLFIAACTFCAMLLGQVHFQGRTLAGRLADTVRFPRNYELVDDTKANVGKAAHQIGVSAPPAIEAARRKLAEWIYPGSPEQLKTKPGKQQ